MFCFNIDVLLNCYTGCVAVLLCRARSITLLWQLSKNEQIEQLSKNGLSTRYSQPVTHVSTNRARRCLTSQIGRDGVCSAWYGPSPPAATLYQQLYEEGRGCAPRSVGYLHGWREAVRRATGQKRRAAVARRCRALPPCGDGLSGCDYPRETVGRRRETGPACGLRKLNQTGGGR